MKRYFILCVILITIASCAHIISEPSRQNAITGIPFYEVFNNTDLYINKIFILGGWADVHDGISLHWSGSVKQERPGRTPAM